MKIKIKQTVRSSWKDSIGSKSSKLLFVPFMRRLLKNPMPGFVSINWQFKSFKIISAIWAATLSHAMYNPSGALDFFLNIWTGNFFAISLNPWAFKRVIISFDIFLSWSLFVFVFLLSFVLFAFKLESSEANRWGTFSNLMLWTLAIRIHGLNSMIIVVSSDTKLLFTKMFFYPALNGPLHSTFKKKSKIKFVVTRS